MQPTVVYVVGISMASFALGYLIGRLVNYRTRAQRKAHAEHLMGGLRDLSNAQEWLLTQLATVTQTADMRVHESVQFNLVQMRKDTLNLMGKLSSHMSASDLTEVHEKYMRMYASYETQYALHEAITPPTQLSNKYNLGELKCL